MQVPADDFKRCRLLAEMLDQHGAALALYAAQWTAEPDDCVQEALIELAGRTEWPARPVAWLYCVVRRRALNAARSQRRRNQREQTAWHDRLLGKSAGSDRQELIDSLAALSESRQEIVLLKVWGNLTFDEMAEVLGRSPATLHREYHRAVAQLRNQWDAPCQKTIKPE